MSNLEKICGAENPNRRGDVVFVHGLDGDARDTWQPDGQTDQFWPDWIGEDLPDVGVWSVGYPANAFAWQGSTMPLADRAVNILVSLHTNDIGTNRPVVFITHSMGGLLVKEMLRKATDGSVPEGEGLALNTRGVVFLSTPHSGSDLANFVNFLKVLLPSDSVRELQPNEPRLRELNTWYRNNVGKLGIETQVYRESRPTKAGEGWLKKRFEAIVVDANSSDPGIPGVTAVPMDDDHITISRPKHTSDFYKRIKKFVVDCLRPSGDVEVLNDTVPSSPQDSNQEILKNVSARDIQPRDLPIVKQSILKGANIGGNLTTGPITQNINNYSAPLPPPLTSTPSNIPYLGASRFVGRKEELKQIHQFLKQDVQVAVSAIAGMGGVGKTELAVQYARSYRNDYSAGVCWFSARAADVGAQILDFAAGLQLVPPEPLDSNLRIAYIWQHWPVRPAPTSNKEEPGDVLLVFDDVENYEQVRPYLPLGLPRFKVLITSRNQLGRNVQHMQLDVLSLEQALELLKSFIARVETEEQSANELCAWLGYLPLGIELVGQYLADREALTLVRMLEQLKEQKLSETSLQRDEQDPDNSSFTARRGVAAAFELSWKTLNDEQKELGCLLSLFSPAEIGWSLVEKVIGQSEEERILNAKSQEKARIRLVKSHLLQSVQDGQSFRLHPLLREFFREKLESSEEIDELKRAYCQALVEESRQIPEVPTRELVEKVLPLIPHLTEVVTTLHSWVEDENLALPFVVLGRFYAAQGAYAQVQPWYEQCLTVCRERLGEEHLDVAASLNNLAEQYRTQGCYGQAEPLFQRALAIWEKVLDPEHLVVALGLNNLAALYRCQGRYEQAEPLFQRALAIREKVLGPEHPDVAQSLNNLAALYRCQGRYEQAESLYERALAIREKVLGPEHPYVAQSLNNLAELYRSQGRYEQTEPLSKRALAIREKVLGLEHPDVAISISELASLYYSQGRYEQAEPLYERALAVHEKVLGPEHPNVATSLNNLAGLYFSQGRYEQAEPLSKRALAIQEKVLGLEHPHVATSLNNLAELYRSQDRYEQAEPLYKRALDIREKVLGPEHPDVAQSLNNLALLYRSQGRYEQAEPLYERALAIREKVLGLEHPDVAASLNDLAGLYFSQGCYEQAELLSKRALAIQEKVLGPEHPDVATSLNNLADLYESQGRYNQAEPLLLQALEMRKRISGEEHPDVATSLNNLAYLYYSQGRYEQAEPLFKRALAIREKVLGPEHPDVVTSLNNLASLYKSQCHYEQAKLLYERALAILEKVLGLEHPNLSTSLNNLAGLYYAQGHYDQAEPLYLRALEIRQRLLGAEHSEVAVATSLNNLAGLYYAQGRYDQAEPLYLRALEMRQQHLGTEHPEVATSLNNLAGLYSSQGRYSEAKILIKHALEISQRALGNQHPLSVALQQNLEAVRGD
jgi:tetratricopeptide (TPR) repeat protein